MDKEFLDIWKYEINGGSMRISLNSDIVESIYFGIYDDRIITIPGLVINEPIFVIKLKNGEYYADNITKPDSELWTGDVYQEMIYKLFLETIREDKINKITE